MKFSENKGDIIANVYDRRTNKFKRHIRIYDETEMNNEYLGCGFSNEKIHDLEKIVSTDQLEKILEALSFSGDGKEIKDLGSEFELNMRNEKLFPVPSISTKTNPFHILEKNTRECCYISAASGAGKSTWASKYIELYKEIFPKNDFVLFSNVEKDKVLDKLKPVRIMINENLIDDPISPSELENSITLFDDIDSIQNNQLRENIVSLRNVLLETGRHKNISVLTTSHQICNYQKTRIIFLEAYKIVLFPKAGAINQIKRVLEVYCGIDKKSINKILGKSKNSRWICIYKRFPLFVLYEFGGIIP